MSYEPTKEENATQQFRLGQGEVLQQLPQRLTTESPTTQTMRVSELLSDVKKSILHQTEKQKQFLRNRHFFLKDIGQDEERLQQQISTIGPGLMGIENGEERFAGKLFGKSDEKKMVSSPNHRGMIQNLDTASAYIMNVKKQLLQNSHAAADSNAEGAQFPQNRAPKFAAATQNGGTFSSAQLLTNRERSPEQPLAGDRMPAQIMMPPKGDLAQNIDFKSRDNLVVHLLDRIEAEKGKLATVLSTNSQPQATDRPSNASVLGAALRVTTTINDSSTALMDCIDPFKKQVEQVLSHRSQARKMEHKLFEKARNGHIYQALQSLPHEVQKLIKSMSFLVKFRKISHLHCEWMSGRCIIVECDQISIEALLRYIDREFFHKSLLNTELGGNLLLHSRAKELLKVSMLPLTGNFSTSAPAAKGNELIDQRFLRVEKVLSTPKMYPLIHKKSLSQIKFTWHDGCSRVLDVLTQIHKGNCCFGLKFTDFDPVFTKEQIEAKRTKIELYLQSQLQIINLTQLQNTLFNRSLSGPFQFWQSLGKIFKMYIVLDEYEQSLNRQFCSILRALALCLFKKWKVECPQAYKMFQIELKAANSNSHESAFENMDVVGEQKMRTPSNRNSHSEKSELMSNNIKGSANGLSGSDQESKEICLRDLTLFQRVLAQNEQILAIQKSVIFDNDSQTHAFRHNEQMLQTFNIFIDNQRLLQQHLISLQQQNSQVKMYENDLKVVQKLKLGSKDQELIKLRDKLLESNNQIFEKIQRRHQNSKSSSENLVEKQDKPYNFNSDSSLSSRNTPIFLFNVYNQTSQNDSKSSNTPTQENNVSENNTLGYNSLNMNPQTLAKNGLNQVSDAPLTSQREGQHSGKVQMSSDQPKERNLVSALQKNIMLFLKQTSSCQANTSQSQEQPLKSNSDEQPNSSGNDQNQAKQATQDQQKSSSNQATTTNTQRQTVQANYNQKKYTSDETIYSNGQRNLGNGKEKRPTPTITKMFKTLKPEDIGSGQKHLNLIATTMNWQVDSNQDLSWLLFQGESEQEIFANPYLFEHDVKILIDGLFDKEYYPEFDSNSSIDYKRYYQAPSQSARDLGVASLNWDSFAAEPLFLVKWEGLSYKDVTWEPISALKGGNYDKVQEFLDAKHSVSMQTRQIIAKQMNIQQQLLRIEEELRTEPAEEEELYAQIFNVQKEVLDEFIVFQLMQINEMRHLFSEPKSQSAVSPADCLKLNNLQKKKVEILLRDFVEKKNRILCDQKGLGKRYTLIHFLKCLKEKQNLNGPFLVITSEPKLAVWENLLVKLGNLKPLIYADSDMGEGMENLRRWCCYYTDVTIMGNLTTRNCLIKFDVLITTAEMINNDDDPFIRKVPFLQVIVEDAHVKKNREATKKIVCKRIICSTSNPMPTSMIDILQLVRTVDPFAVHSSVARQLPREITSFDQLKSMWNLVNPYTSKSFQSDVEKLFGQLCQVDLEVPMTPAQLVIYKEIYARHSKLIGALGSLDSLSVEQQTELELVDELLLKACSSVFLIDKNEQLLEKCKQMKQFGKRELKTSMKQQLVSGKISVLQQILKNFNTTSNKTIICTHYAHMLVLLKKIFKETGVACFMYTPPMSFDCVFRFNLYSGPAVFLLHIGQTWTQAECSFFDLDLIQNIIIFDQKGAFKSDLINLFQVCQLPFSMDVTVYRLMAQHSYEQKLFLRKQRMQKLQGILFSQDNPWLICEEAYLESLRINYPLSVSTQDEISGTSSVTQIPPRELDLIMRLAAEPIAEAQNDLSPHYWSTESCLSLSFQNALIQQEQDTAQLQELIEHAKLNAQQFTSSQQVQELYHIAKALEECHTVSRKDICSADYYSKVLGSQCETESMDICHHSLCKNIFAMNTNKKKDRKEHSLHGLGKLYEIQEQLSKQKGPNMPPHNAIKNDNYFSSRWNPGNAKFQSLINKEIDSQQGKFKLNDHMYHSKLAMDMGGSDYRKPLSEEDRKDSPRGFDDKMDFQVINRHAQVSEDNTIQKPFESEEPIVKSVDDSHMQLELSASRLQNCEEKKNETKKVDFDQVGGKRLNYLNQPDKLLPNGKVCPVCLCIVEEKQKQGGRAGAKEAIYTCLGPCKKMMHKYCAEKQSIIVQGSVKPQSELPNEPQQPNSCDEEADVPQRQSATSAVEKYTFMCKYCQKSLAQCFKCKKYAPIEEQTQPKEKSFLINTSADKRKERISNERSQSNLTEACVEKCIVGSCLKYYHFNCLHNNQNVDFYTNNRNQSRFRCPLHYCSGCSISGNSVQILQCVACPTSYHLKCFRADRGAIKLTKKFILCGQHEEQVKKIQLNNKKRVKLASAQQQTKGLQKQENGNAESSAAHALPSDLTAGMKTTHGQMLVNRNSTEVAESLDISKGKLTVPQPEDRDGEAKNEERVRDAKAHLKTFIRINTALNSKVKE